MTTFRKWQDPVGVAQRRSVFVHMHVGVMSSSLSWLKYPAWGAQLGLFDLLFGDQEIHNDWCSWKGLIFSPRIRLMLIENFHVTSCKSMG